MEEKSKTDQRSFAAKSPSNRPRTDSVEGVTAEFSSSSEQVITPELQLVKQTVMYSTNADVFLCAAEEYTEVSTFS